MTIRAVVPADDEWHAVAGPGGDFIVAAEVAGGLLVASNKGGPPEHKSGYPLLADSIERTLSANEVLYVLCLRPTPQGLVYDAANPILGADA